MLLVLNELMRVGRVTRFRGVATFAVMVYIGPITANVVNHDRVEVILRRQLEELADCSREHVSPR